MNRKLLFLLPVLVTLLLTPTPITRTTAEAAEEGSQSDPTAWWWYHGVTAAQITQLINTNQARIVAIKVEQASPSYRFTVALVRNQGVYAKTWWWYYGLTASQLATNLQNLNARIISLQVNEVGGQLLFTAALVSNAGTENKAWWWYYNVTPAQLSNYLSANKARLIDLDTYFVGGQRRYSAVMISNTGADQKAWWWYYNISPSQINTLLWSNKARLVDIEQHDPGAGTFTVVMEQCPCPYWWWYYGVGESQLGDLLAQNGARIINIEPYSVGGQKRFAAIMINNSNAVTTRVGQILRSGADGATGLYLKQVGGPVLAALQENKIFEPASTLKVDPLLYAMRQVQAGSASLTGQVPIYGDVAGSCPGAVTANKEPLRDALQKMMQFSDNERTRAIIETFGVQNINNMAQAIGLTSTRINHSPGCGGPTPNTLTLANAGLLYEGVANGSLLNPTNRGTFFSLMAGKDTVDFSGAWDKTKEIIDAEAPAGMTVAKKENFKNQIRMSYKAGGYTLPGGNPWFEHRSIAGWAQIPFCTGSVVAPRQYVFGIFIDRATNAAAADATWNNAKVELLREPIRSALSNWASCG